MADDKDPKPQDPQKDPAPEPKPDDNKPGPVPYERFKEVNDSYKAMQDKLAKLEKKQKDAEEAQLKEQGKWQELAETNEKKAGQLEQEITRLRVSIKKGLPESLADRLRGSTIEEMEADADSLLELVEAKKQSTTTFTKHDKNSEPQRIENTAKAIREHTAEIIENMRKNKQ